METRRPGLYIVSLPGDPGTGPLVAERLGARHVSVYSKTFPDGETYLRIPERPVAGADVVVVQSMYPEQDRRFFETLEALDILREHRGRVYLVLLYMAYARQDKVFLEGEPVSARVVLEAFSRYSLERIYVVEPHSAYIGGFPRVSVIDGVSPIVEEVYREIVAGGDRVYVVSPDQGGVERASRAAERLGASLLSFRKYRDRYTGEIRSEPPEGLERVSGAVAVVVDDIISTGGTIAETVAVLKRAGASRVYVLCTHCLFVRDALERVVASGVDRVFCGKTVRPPVTDPRVLYIDLSKKVSEALERDL